MPDTPGHVATNHDTEYSLSVEEAAQLYANAGHPRTLRTVQRYCASGHLDCVKAATTLGDKYFVSPQSVARHIAQIEELVALEANTTVRGMSRPDATQKSAVQMDDSQRHERPAETENNEERPQMSRDSERPPSRHNATGHEVLSSYVEQLKGEKDQLKDDIAFLKQQIHTKDEQISALLDRDRETNFLIQGLQQMLTPLLGAPRTKGDDENRPPVRYEQ